MGYGIEATTADCYPGTSCLINKLGIQDEEQLATTEAAIIHGTAANFLSAPPMIIMKGNGLKESSPVGGGTMSCANVRLAETFGLICGEAY